jgi:hypothetical protein
MIEHKINEDEHFVAGWYTDRMDIIDKTNEWFDSEKKNGNLYRGKLGYFEIKEEYKDSWELQFSDNLPLMNEYLQFVLEPALKSYLKKYEHANNTWYFGVDQNINLQEYPRGGVGFSKWHFEQSTKDTINRYLVFMTYLNDIEDEGQTEFLYQDLAVKPEKGLTLIFPAGFTHTHRGLASRTDEKRIVTGWFVFDMERELTEDDKIDKSA